MQKNNKDFLNRQDDLAIRAVSDYINKHYFLDTPQEKLEKIAMMSGTKLKSSFKKKYNMTITEYTQRKRVKAAEKLLLSSDLAISDVAKTVGYKSHSSFTRIFKRYMGCYPKDIRKT